jgi:hypothetical protein
MEVSSSSGAAKASHLAALLAAGTIDLPTFQGLVSLLADDHDRAPPGRKRARESVGAGLPSPIQRTKPLRKSSITVGAPATTPTTVPQPGCIQSVSGVTPKRRLWKPNTKTKQLRVLLKVTCAKRFHSVISTELSPLYRKVGKKNYIREALFADAVTDVAKRALRLSGDKLKELGATAQDILDVCRWQVKKDRGNFMQALRAGRSPQTIWEGVVAEDELTSYDWDKALRRVLDDTHTPAKTNPVAATHSAAAAANSCDKAVEVVIADLFGASPSEDEHITCCTDCKIQVNVGRDAWQKDHEYLSRAFPKPVAGSAWPPPAAYCEECWTNLEEELEVLAVNNSHARGKKKKKKKKKARKQPNEGVSCSITQPTWRTGGAPNHHERRCPTPTNRACYAVAGSTTVAAAGATTDQPDDDDGVSCSLTQTTTSAGAPNQHEHRCPKPHVTAYTWKVDDIVSAKYDGKFYYADIMANTGPTVLVYFHQDGQTAHVPVKNIRAVATYLKILSWSECVDQVFRDPEQLLWIVVAPDRESGNYHCEGYPNRRHICEDFDRGYVLRLLRKGMFE